MENYKLEINATPVNKTCGFIYMGYHQNDLIIGETTNSLAKRYGKTVIAWNWFGIDLQNFEKWRNIDKILNRAKQESKKRTSKGKPLCFEYEGTLMDMGYKSNLTKDFNKIAEKLLIHICNRQFGKPLGRIEETYKLPEETFVLRNLKTGLIENLLPQEIWINDILKNHFMPVWELMLEDVKTYNQPQHLIELYEELYPKQKTA